MYTSRHGTKIKQLFAAYVYGLPNYLIFITKNESIRNGPEGPPDVRKNCVKKELNEAGLTRHPIDFLKVHRN